MGLTILMSPFIIAGVYPGYFIGGVLVAFGISLALLINRFFSCPARHGIGRGTVRLTVDLFSAGRKKSLSKILTVTACIFVTVCGASNAGPHIPEIGSKERKAIVDALRVPVQNELKNKIIFKVDHLRVMDGWAFLWGVPQLPGGKPVDYQQTPYADAGEAFDDGICALLHFSNDEWTVKIYVIGSTDVPYVEWDKEFGAPSELFK
jgi:hypothetical protein